MNFTVQSRANTGKGYNRKLRAIGMTPGVIYGQGEQTLVSMRQDVATRFILSLGGVKQLIKLTVESEGKNRDVKAIVQDYQTSNVGNKLVHMDFLEVTDETELTIDVIIEPTGESIGVKQGGVMQFIRRSIPVRCQAGAIPKAFDADITDLDVGDSFHVLDIKYPEGVTPVIGERNYTIITVTGRAAEEVDEIDEVEEIEAETTETEATETEATE
ncbi:MAG: 50S ribosomal protein L25 [Proteobacteria bacterium]|nr:50S ribosomal protein L25 [Pseudomonadota bacterium]